MNFFRKQAPEVGIKQVDESFVLKLETQMESDELTKILTRYEPWGHRIDFSNGVSTSALNKRTPFNHAPLRKVKTTEIAIPYEQFRGGRVLDIGCNSGYNSIYLASMYNMKPIGIDITSRHIEVSNLLSGIAHIDANYMIANAETYCEEGAFDVVLHFGTLYHLPNPLLSLNTAYANLKKGGYLALETQVYDHPDNQNICYFMYMQNNDSSNFWALSTHVLMTYLNILGFVEIRELRKTPHKTSVPYMSRINLVAKK